MKTAKKAAFSALAATVVALAGPATLAHADNPGDTLTGGCGFNSGENQVATNGQNEGVIYVAAASQDGSPAAPSGATVSCWIDVNGVQATPTLTTHGTGAIANAAQISYSAVTGDQVTECQQVTFDDGSPWVGPDGTNPDCPAATSVDFPPPAVQGAIDTVIATINTVLALTDAINPIICPIFAALGPQNIAGIVTISSNGSLDIADPVGLIEITNTCA